MDDIGLTHFYNHVVFLFFFLNKFSGCFFLFLLLSSDHGKSLEIFTTKYFAILFG